MFLRRNDLLRVCGPGHSVAPPCLLKNQAVLCAFRLRFRPEPVLTDGCPASRSGPFPHDGPFAEQGRSYRYGIEPAAVADLCRKHGVSTGDLRSRRNSPVIMAARRECAAMLRSAGMSLPQIGRILHRTPYTVYNLLRSRRSEGGPP